MVKKNKQLVTSPYVWAVAIIIALTIGFLFLRPFLGVTVFGLLLAFIFYPIYNYFLKYLHNKGRSALVTTIVATLVVGVPLLIISTLAVTQALRLANELTNKGIIVLSQVPDRSVDGLVGSANSIIESTTGIKDAIKSSDITNFASSTLPTIIKYLSSILINIVGSLPSFFTSLIIFLFVFVSGLMGGKELRRLVEDLSPFDDRTNKLYLERVGAMAKAMIKGQLLIAIVQGILSAAVLALFGYSHFFIILAIIFMFLSFIPLGAGIVTIPIGIIMLLFGNIAGGLVVLLNHFVVVTNVDNYIRPKVVPVEARLPAVLTILSALAGVVQFGFVGVIYGPMIMIVIVTTIEAYLAYKKRLSVR